MTSDPRHAADVVAYARGREVVLWADGGSLRYRSVGTLPPDLKALLVAWRVPLLDFLMDATLEAQAAAADAVEAEYLREERAGILEHQAGFTREEAERMAGLALCAALVLWVLPALIMRVSRQQRPVCLAMNFLSVSSSRKEKYEPYK